jgi:predicted nuclease with TOPRIM domain
MSALLDEIAALEAEAAEAAALRVECAELAHENDELRQRVADLEQDGAEVIREQFNRLSDECACAVKTIDDLLGVRNLPVALRFQIEELAALAGDPR